MHAHAIDLLDSLTKHKKILITTHIRPDGDALGSTAAMASGLTQLGIEASVLLLSKMPAKYSFVYDELGLKWTEAKYDGLAASGANLLEPTLEAFDALLVIDTGTWSQLPGLKTVFEAAGKPAYVIDHHKTQEDWATKKWVDTSAAAACELAFDALEYWNTKLDAPLAQAIYTGMATDSGWFAYSSTTPGTLRRAAKLMEAGVNTDLLHQRLFQNERPERLKIATKAIPTLQLLADNRIALMSISKADFESMGATTNDTEGLVNWALQAAKVQVSALLNESPEGGPIRISLRSKGQLDVAHFAQAFGGGGHARAAGMKLELPLEGAVKKLGEELVKAMS